MRKEAHDDRLATRDELNQLRKEASEERQTIRKDLNQFRKEAQEDRRSIRDEMREGFANIGKRLEFLYQAILDICSRLGRLEGKAEAQGEADES